MNRLGDQSSTPTNVQKVKSSNKTPLILSRTPQPSSTKTLNPLRLLIEKLVFLDLNTSYKHLGKLKECLITIGVVSSLFFRHNKFHSVFYLFNRILPIV